MISTLLSGSSLDPVQANRGHQEWTQRTQQGRALNELYLVHDARIGD